jgi:hypothetical protein
MARRFANLFMGSFRLTVFQFSGIRLKVNQTRLVPRKEAGGQHES